MEKLREAGRRVRMLFQRDRFDRELDEEMRSHIEMQADENLRRGMPPEEARYAATRQFGNPTVLREASHRAWGWGFIEDTCRDFGYALRVLRRQPGFAATAILSLALGIGANTAIFGLIRAILLRPLDIPEPEKLVSIYHRSSEGWLSSSSYPDYAFYREHSNVFSGMLAYLRVPMLVRIGEDDEKVYGELVSSDYFHVLGLKPAAGRWFSHTEEPLVVIGYDFWARHFGSDPAVLGRSLKIGSGVFTIAAVAPRGFLGLVLDWGEPPDVWVPMGTYRRAVPALSGADVLNYWGMHSFLVAGRLRPGVSPEQARAALAVASSRAAPFRAQAFPKNWRFEVEVHPAQNARFWPDYRASVTRMLSLLAAAAALILLIACLNLASLLLARASRRQREIAIRLSLGSGRGRLIRQLLTESLLLSLAGGAAGLMVAYWTTTYLASYRGLFRVPIAVNAPLDGTVIVFTALLSLATALLFGLIPATQASRLGISGALRSEPAGLRRTYIRDGLIVVQVALSLVLLAGAGLFLRTVGNARAADITPRPEKVLTVRLDPAGAGLDESRRMLFFMQALDRVKALPSVENAALVELLPLGGMRGGTDVVVEHTKLQVDYNTVTPGYFETAGLPLVRGRAFTDGDRAGAPGVAVVNELFARRFWPGQDALGRRFGLTWPGAGGVEVVGVVRDGKFRNFRDTHRPCFYVALAQRPRKLMNLEVRTAGDPMALAGAIRREIRAVNPGVPVADFTTLRSVRERGMAQERLMAALLTGFGLVALALAAIGIYGVVAFSVARRTREIGIRIALGARPGKIARAVLLRSAALALAGAAVGILGALALGRLFASLLYGVSHYDPRMYIAAALLLLTVALAAGYLPARRAAAVDPVQALRHE